MTVALIVLIGIGVVFVLSLTTHRAFWARLTGRQRAPAHPHSESIIVQLREHQESFKQTERQIQARNETWGATDEERRDYIRSIVGARSGDRAANGH